MATTDYGSGGTVSAIYEYDPYGNEVRHAGPFSDANPFPLQPGGRGFGAILCRRVEEARAGVFADDGRFFFTSSGDIWEGGIEPVEDAAAEDELGRLGTLVGARITPLAMLNTDEANGGGMWVEMIAPAGKWLFAKLRGRHIAAVVRVPLPARPLYSPGNQQLPSVKDTYKAMVESLSKAEIIADDLEDVAGFCACEVVGKLRVLYATRSGREGVGPSLVLWEGEGTPKVIGNAPPFKP